MVFGVVYKAVCVRFGALRLVNPAVKSDIRILQAGTDGVSGLLQQPQNQGKAKEPAACNSQAASPFGRLNNFCLTFRGHFKKCLAVVFEGMKSIWSCFSNLE